MRFYKNQHQYYCGIDLHSKIMYLCADEGIPFVLGHALYMKAIHGGIAKNDKIDSEKIALLLKSGMFPEAYIYQGRFNA